VGSFDPEFGDVRKKSDHALKNAFFRYPPPTTISGERFGPLSPIRSEIERIEVLPSEVCRGVVGRQEGVKEV
jgi:hypothetical protein